MTADTSGTTNADHLNGGSGNDTLSGYAGNDFLNGGSGSDVLDGGSGSDRVDGDAGNDVLVYRASENVGSTDIYDGGSGIDTLRLLLTRDEWMQPSLQTDVANYLAFIAANTLPNEQANNAEFRFSSFDLRVSKTERLEVYVDGVLINPVDRAVIARNDAITTNEESVSTAINLLANDSVPDLVQDVVIVSGPTKGSIGLSKDFSNVANPTANAIYTPNTALQSLALGESTTDTFSYKVIDADGDVSIATVTVTITGSNDAPVITSEPGDSADTTLLETNAGLFAAGTLTASDVDTSDIISASIMGVTHTGPTGGLSDAQLLSYFQVTAGAIDTAATASGKLTWNFKSGAQAFDFLAAGETLTLHYTIRPDDGHNPPPIGNGVVTIHITGTNDIPMITGGAVEGAVHEDGTALSAIGALAASDVDRGSVLTWSVSDGVSVVPANYQIALDQLKITKGSTVVFEDNFNNGGAPPVLTNDASAPFATSYSVQGTVAEVGGRAIFDYASGIPSDSFNTPDPGVFGGASLLSNIDPSDSLNGLKLATDFKVETRFDLAVPDIREAYGIRLADRVLGSTGNPPDQVGDDVVDLLVRRDNAGVLSVALRELDFTTESVSVISATPFTPPADADQIVLRLTHAANAQAVQASFDYLHDGSVIERHALAGSASIFSNENWTRAQIIASAPQQVTSVLDPHYGTPTIDQDGNWTYTLANDRTNVQALADGQTAIDTFSVQVTDEHGATASQAVNITVAGSNDAPILQGGSPTQPIGRTIAEIGDNVPGENTALRSVTGLLSFLDWDLIDTHTATATALGSGYRGVMTASVSADSTAGHGGYVTWTYKVQDDALDDLAQDQVLLQDYRITVDDGHGGTDARTVRIFLKGSNDAPVVSAEPGDATGATLVESNAGLAASGTLTAHDVDIADTLTLSVTGVTHSGPTGGLSDVELLSYFGVNPGVFDDPFSTGGRLTWAFDSGNQAFDFLAAGETLTLNYTIRAGDGHLQAGTGDRVVTIAISGTDEGANPGGGTGDNNHAPTLQDVVGTGQSLDQINGLTLSGVIGFFDVDLSDAHTVSLEPLATGYLGTLASTIDTDSTGTGQGTIALSYRLTPEQFQAANGQIPDAQNYRITVDDGHGGQTSEIITLRLADILNGVAGGGGQNHDPVLNLPPSPIANVFDDPNAAQLSANGLIDFSDPDTVDTHTVLVTPLANVWGHLVAEVGPDSTGVGAGGHGQVQWHYQVDEALVRPLAGGEFHFDQFDLRLSDSAGGFDAETVTIGINGGNEAPVIHGETNRTVETSAAGTISRADSVIFSDADLTDTHYVEYHGDGLPGPGGVFEASLLRDTSNGTGGEVRWTYNLDPANVQYLAEGETASETWHLSSHDVDTASRLGLPGPGMSAVQNITFVTEGLNDLPYFVGPIVGGNGAFFTTFGDPDLSDRHSVSALFNAPASSREGEIGTLAVELQQDSTGSAGPSGIVKWTYHVGTAQGPIHQVYDILVEDNHGGRSLQTFVFDLG